MITEPKPPTASSEQRLLWWGRSGLDYSRNRIVRQHLRELGWDIADYWPRISRFGDIEALWRVQTLPDLVWVPCFRQRDLAAASRWAHARGVPVVFDALISAYDKAVFERQRFPPSSLRARRLLRWETRLLRSADRILVDTNRHARFFQEALHVPPERITVVPVGAEESLFTSAYKSTPTTPLQVLFYGSFIPLQGPEHVIEAARLSKDKNIIWHLLGSGPLLNACKTKAQNLSNVVFEDWIEYETLPARIHQADILLGVFGTTDKAQRVIPNKVYQALACGRPVVTQASDTYPPELLKADRSGIGWVQPGNPADLARAVANFARTPSRLAPEGAHARATYEHYFSGSAIRDRLSEALRNTNIQSA